MIDQFTGTLLRKGGTSILVEARPWTLEVLVPLSTSAVLPDEGNEVRLHTHLQWKDDGPSLFGFADEQERKLFRLLIQVQGVGPRIGLAILGHLPPVNLVAELKSRSELAFTAVPGVGKKTAGRILIELGPVADKMELEGRAIDSVGPPIDVDEDALQALTALGYPPREAQKALEAVNREDAGQPLSDQVRLALRVLTQSPSRARR